jgi:hypothetical protein
MHHASFVSLAATSYWKFKNDKNKKKTNYVYPKVSHNTTIERNTSNRSQKEMLLP